MDSDLKLFDATESQERPQGPVWDDPVAHARARIAMCADICMSDINRVVRAVHRDYQMSRTDWSDALSELHGQVATFVGLVAQFIEEGDDSDET